jgi:uncharacterized membrane protein
MLFGLFGNKKADNQKLKDQADLAFARGEIDEYEYQERADKLGFDREKLRRVI